jgi:hypothetical protein
MDMKKGSRIDRRRHPACDRTHRRSRAHRNAGFKSIFTRRRAGIAVSGAVIALICTMALYAKVHAQAMPGTMTVPGTPPETTAAGGAAPTAPESVGPHVSYTSSPLATNPANPSVKLQASPVGRQEAPDVIVSPTATKMLEHTPPAPNVVLHQWSFTRELPEESLFSQAYMRTREEQAHSISLKEALYIALKNNPAVAAASLEPVLSLQGVRGSWAVFDPDLTGQAGEQKTVTPTTSSLQTGGAKAFVQKSYIWNFAINKTLATTNGTLGATFTNNWFDTNSAFSSVNPAYTPAITLSLSQPLLRNFGNQFATINVRIAESNQKQAQYDYEQQLNDFVLKVGTDLLERCPRRRKFTGGEQGTGGGARPGAPEYDQRQGRSAGASVSEGSAVRRGHRSVQCLSG